MSDIDELAQAATIEQDKSIKFKPFYQQFTPLLMMFFFIMILVLGATATLFHHKNTQNNALVEYQLVPLKQQLQQTKVIYNSEKLLNALLNPANVENFVELHNQLITTNRQLLELTDGFEQPIQQWLTQNKSIEDIVVRIQDRYSRNQELKESSINQLEQMLQLSSMLIETQLAEQKLLTNQLQTPQLSTVQLNKVRAYAQSVNKLNHLQQLNLLFQDSLEGFKKLSVLTSLTDFESLREKVDRILVLQKQLNLLENIPSEADFNQQINTFENFMYGEHRVLAKWQGYLRLAQEYLHELTIQQQQIALLSVEPLESQQVKGFSALNRMLMKYDILLSSQQISNMLALIIGLLVVIFCFLLWRFSQKIKVSSSQSVEIIHQSLQHLEENNTIVGNCTETQKVIEYIRNIAKPVHTEQEFQALSHQYNTAEQELKKQQQTLKQLMTTHEEYELLQQEKMANLVNEAIQRYQYLIKLTLPLVQQQQYQTLTSALTYNVSNNKLPASLSVLFNKLSQFYLALEIESEKSVLKLIDLNLLDEMYAILFTKQNEQQINGNQLLISHDEQLLKCVKVDYCVFSELINVFLDIILTHRKSSQVHIHLQLKDKNAGQQRVNFVVKIKDNTIETLPSEIRQLLDANTTTQDYSPLVYVFNTLLLKQHGNNFVAQLIDGGYQCSFELPLALTSSTDNHNNENLLDNIKILLLSNNITLTKIIENTVISAKGKFNHLTRIDSFVQQVTASKLSNHKLDMVVVSSDLVADNIKVITKTINDLPQSLQPKLMVLQSAVMKVEQFGFYSQTDYVFCKENFLQNIKELQHSIHGTNQLIPCEQFALNQYVNTQLHVLLAVKSPQAYQNLQRLLSWLGLQVKIICNPIAQNEHWQSGQFTLLMSEFAEQSFVEMANKPLIDVGVFSLTNSISNKETNTYFNNWSVGRLSETANLTELASALAPWLKEVELTNRDNCTKADSLTTKRQDVVESMSEDLVITEVAHALTENNTAAAFDFYQYLQHQGSVELALFMLEDYTQENHQLLDGLIKAIKAKNINDAQLCISSLTLNANILSSSTLQSLCVKWSKLLNGKEIPSSLNKINTLFKQTRLVLNEIDEYAEAI